MQHENPLTDQVNQVDDPIRGPRRAHHGEVIHQYGRRTRNGAGGWARRSATMKLFMFGTSKDDT
jgi:hypothetical protein